MLGFSHDIELQDWSNGCIEAAKQPSSVTSYPLIRAIWPPCTPQMATAGASDIVAKSPNILGECALLRVRVGSENFKHDTNTSVAQHCLAGSIIDSFASLFAAAGRARFLGHTCMVRRCLGLTD